MNTLIEFRDVTLGYRRHVVLSGLSFAIDEGEFFGIVGANGSGKTTILRAMLGIISPTAGRIEFAGRQERMRFGYVPQKAHIDELFPFTAREIVLMGRYGLLPPGRRPTDEDRRIAEQQLEHVGIGALAGKRFRDMSGGQKQRTLFARALAAEAKVLLMDEPTEGMDLEGQHAILELIGRLRAESGVSVVYVTHRLNELADSAERLLLLHDGQVQVGPTEELLTPQVLYQMYGVHAAVEMVAGKRVIVL
ncbi:MAG TPA: metal ABC transporter ATP-binding protein [Candidatus Limnocylindrales bacterium]|nr:metal ABC transporter ATP-binding protein [Candidatus Limnocylindrales bacterium]